MAAATVKRTTRRVRRWRAWAGSFDDFDRLTHLFAQLAEQRRRAYLQEWDADNVLRSGATEGERKLHDGERARAVRRSEPKLNLWQDGDEIRGPIEVIRKEIDPRSFKMLCLSGEFGTFSSEEFTLALMRKDRFTGESELGVSLDVKSGDRDWTVTAFAQLSEEIVKAVPRWNWARAMWARISLGTCLSVGLLQVIAAFTPGGATPVALNQPGPWLAAAAVGVAVGALIFPLIMWERLWGWLFPAVEISHSGTSSSWTRLGVILSLALSLPIGLLVNGLYDRI